MIPALVVMTLISFAFRYAPFVVAKWLQKWTILEKLAHTLPICILMLLVAHNLDHAPSCGLPEIIGLAAAVMAQLAFRSILLSMTLAVACHQLLLRII